MTMMMTITMMMAMGVHGQDFSLGKDRRAEGREWGGVLREVAATPPHQPEGLGERCELLQRGSGEPRPPKGFPLLSALEDGLCLLIVDYYATTGGASGVDLS